MANYSRTDRVSEEIKRELSAIIFICAAAKESAGPAPWLMTRERVIKCANVSFMNSSFTANFQKHVVKKYKKL